MPCRCLSLLPWNCLRVKNAWNAYWRIHQHPPFLLTQLEAGKLPASVALEIDKFPANEQPAAFARYLSGELSRDALAGNRKNRQHSCAVPTTSKPRRARAVLGKGRAVTLSAPSLDLDGAIQLLSELVDQLRKARTRGLALGTALKVIQETSCTGSPA